MPISIPTSINGVVIPGIIKGPLRDLQAGPEGKITYHFPRDLGINPTRQHWIQFIVNEIDKSQVQSDGLVTGVTDMLSTGMKAYTSAVDTTAKSMADTTKSKLETMADTAIASVKMVGDTVQVGGKKSVDIISGNPSITKSVSVAYVNLYMPDTINFSFNHDYSDESLTGMLGKPYFYGQLASSLYDKVKNENSDTGWLARINDWGNDPSVRTLLAQLVGDQDLRDLSLRAIGYAINPQLQVLFRGTSFRSFTFDFLMTPFSAQEAETIKKIIRTLRYYSAPTVTDPTKISNYGMFFEVPATFDIKFMMNGIENPNIPKIERCVLQSMDVDYAPNGWTAHKDGHPVQTRLHLNFKEIVLIDRKKISMGEASQSERMSWAGTY